MERQDREGKEINMDESDNNVSDRRMYLREQAKHVTKMFLDLIGVGCSVGLYYIGRRNNYTPLIYMGIGGFVLLTLDYLRNFRNSRVLDIRNKINRLENSLVDPKEDGNNGVEK